MASNIFQQQANQHADYNYNKNKEIDSYNRAYLNDGEESGIDTMSQFTPVAPVNNSISINTNPFSKLNSSSAQIQNVLNTSSISFDLMNYNAPTVKTRYDVKSNASGSLYGSKKSISGMISIDTRGDKPYSSGRKSRLKQFIDNKVFKDDTSYATGEYEKDENHVALPPLNKKDERESWSGRFDFFLSCLGYAVGLGAVWRFPYLCYKNGGGVFLIPYFIFLFFVGIPIFYLELNLGQFTSQGPFNCWKMAPIFKGLGISMNIASFYFCLYYNMIIAYSLYYLFASFKTTLDWTKCHYTWASINCTDDFSDSFLIRCDQADVYRDMNGLCYNYSSNAGRTPIGWWDIKKRLEYRKPVLPSQDYFNNHVLQKTNGIENSNEVVWQLAISLFIAWVIVFFCVFKGIKSSGKVVYFTSLFPYIVLLILGINGWTLQGAGKGIGYYLKPDFSKLLDVNVWFDAAVQIFFTMSTSYGGLITLASYNKFNQNTLRDTFIITFSNALTAIFAGFVVFSYIGYLSHITQQDVNQVVSSGSGLSFIVFPFAVTQMPGSPFWAILFFIMMLTLGLDSQFATLETIITSIVDAFPRIKKYKIILIGVLCSSMYLIGLVFCTRGGQYWIEIFDKYSGGWAVLLIGALECICIGWVYGYNKFKKDIHLMIGKQCDNKIIDFYWVISWKFVSPVLLILLVGFSWAQYKPLTSDDYVFPFWANLIGWLLSISVISGTIGWAFYCIVNHVFCQGGSFVSLFRPEAEWGPLRIEHKRLAIHLENLEPYHDSKRVKKLNVSTVSIS